MFVFFFSSRRRHTRFSRDWSSDVCSSDLAEVHAAAEGLAHGGDPGHGLVHRARTVDQLHLLGAVELEGVEAELAVAADLLDQVGRAVAAGPAVGLHPVTHAAAEKLDRKSTRLN